VRLMISCPASENLIGRLVEARKAETAGEKSHEREKKLHEALQDKTNIGRTEAWDLASSFFVKEKEKGEGGERDYGSPGEYYLGKCPLIRKRVIFGRRKDHWGKKKVSAWGLFVQQKKRSAILNDHIGQTGKGLPEEGKTCFEGGRNEGVEGREEKQN